MTDLTQQGISNELMLLCRDGLFILTSEENQGNLQLNGDNFRENFREILMTSNKSLVLKKIRHL